MKLKPLWIAVCATLTSTAVHAQSWQDWSKDNPTYDSGGSSQVEPDKSFSHCQTEASIQKITSNKVDSTKFKGIDLSQPVYEIILTIENTGNCPIQAIKIAYDGLEINVLGNQSNSLIVRHTDVILRSLMPGKILFFAYFGDNPDSTIIEAIAE